MKKTKKIRKRSVTLIELMIVILLIGIIGGALTFNMKGSLDQGKKFKTEQNRERVLEILRMEYAKGDASLDEIASEWKEIVASSPLVKGSEVIKDGWNHEFNVSVASEDEDFIVKSEKYNQFQHDHKAKSKKKKA